MRARHRGLWHWVGVLAIVAVCGAWLASLRWSLIRDDTRPRPRMNKLLVSDGTLYVSVVLDATPRTNPGDVAAAQPDRPRSGSVSWSVRPTPSAARHRWWPTLTETYLSEERTVCKTVTVPAWVILFPAGIVAARYGWHRWARPFRPRERVVGAPELRARPARVWTRRLFFAAFGIGVFLFITSVTEPVAFVLDGTTRFTLGSGGLGIARSRPINSGSFPMNGLARVPMSGTIRTRGDGAVILGPTVGGYAAVGTAAGRGGRWFWLPWVRSNRAVQLVFIPLWPVVLTAVLGTGWLLWSQFVPIGHCPLCRYSLAGLAPGAPCPECGAAPARPVAASV